MLRVGSLSVVVSVSMKSAYDRAVILLHNYVHE